MALTADRKLEGVPPDEILDLQAGAADTLYGGGLVNIGTDGYIKVAADVANEVDHVLTVLGAKLGVDHVVEALKINEAGKLVA